MKKYSHDYTLVQEAMDSLYSATRLHANECYGEALERICEARTILQKYLSQDNMVPDDDVEGGWVRTNDAEAAIDNLEKLCDHYRKTMMSMGRTGVEVVRHSEELYAENDQLKSKVVKHRQIDSRFLKQQTEGADPSNPLYEKTVVESGTYEQIAMTRDQVAEAIQKLGAKLNRDVSKTMNVFVVGNKPGPSKMKKVQQWREEGLDIRIVSQIEFKEIYDKYVGKK